MSPKSHWLLLPAIALLAVLPFLVQGPTCGHDLGFHLVSWLAAAQSFAHGDLHPSWITAPAFDAGEPRFLFYPPLSWTLGGALTLFAEIISTALHAKPERLFTLVPALYTWLALTAAGLAMHNLVRRYVGPAASLAIAVVYLANPYMLFTAYERTAFAELLAAALLPLLLGSLLDSRIRVAKLAIFTALLWLTNAPAAVMACYAIALVAGVRTVTLATHSRTRPEALRLALQVTAATLLGLGLASFYLLPAAYERRWVEISMAIIPSLRIEDNTLFHHFGNPFHDAVNHTASIIAVMLATVAAAALAASFRANATRVSIRSAHQPSQTKGTPLLERIPEISLFALTIAILFLLTPLSLPVWHTLPELAFLQFPWRLLALLAPTSCLLLALALRDRWPLRWPASVSALCAFALAAALIFPAYASFHQSCEVADTPSAILATLAVGRGTEPTDEYTPEPADNDALRPDNPAFYLAATPDAPAPEHTTTQPAPRHLDLSLHKPSFLILNLRDYPAWRVARNGSILSDRVARDDGLLAIPLPAGTSHIDLTFTQTRDRIAGDLVSLLALMLVLGLGLTSRPSEAAVSSRGPDL